MANAVVLLASPAEWRPAETRGAIGSRGWLYAPPLSRRNPVDVRFGQILTTNSISSLRRAFRSYRDTREEQDYLAILAPPTQMTRHPGHSSNYVAALQAVALGWTPKLAGVYPRVVCGAGMRLDKATALHAGI